MAASSRSFSAWFLGLCVSGLWLLGSCAAGAGEGSATGQVWAPECGFEGEVYDLRPDFFAMEPSASVEIIDIRMQRGSELQSYSDGISVFIAEPERVKEELLGTDLEFELIGSMVEMTLYLNKTCPFLSQIPVVYRAVSGTIRFDDLYVPWIHNDDKWTRAVFTNVELVDTRDPETRHANMSGDLSFLIQRGMPAQPFGL